MSNDRDIIGIVREFSDKLFHIERQMTFRETDKNALAREILEKFPAIARALLIAVERLEQDRDVFMVQAASGLKASGASQRLVEEVLSQIRSL